MFMRRLNNAGRECVQGRATVVKGMIIAVSAVRQLSQQRVASPQIPGRGAVTVLTTTREDGNGKKWCSGAAQICIARECVVRQIRGVEDRTVQYSTVQYKLDSTVCQK